MKWVVLGLLGALSVSCSSQKPELPAFEKEGAVSEKDSTAATKNASTPAPSVSPPQSSPTPAVTTDSNTSKNNPANPAVTPAPAPAPAPVPAPVPSPSPSPAPAPEVPKSTVPVGCEGMSADTDNDVVIFDGGKVTVTNNSIALLNGWVLGDLWGNGRIGTEDKDGRTAITYSGEEIYHGFKFSPAAVNGERKKFKVKMVQVYADTSRSQDNATYGIRFIKPGEDEGNGGAPTTTWGQKAVDSNTADFPSHFHPVTKTCKLVTMYLPKVFLDSGAVANRLIWEMQQNWSSGDKLYVYKIVLKDFSYQ